MTGQQPRFTRRLDELGAGEVALAGGKAANLGELTTAGFPVPAGFVLTTVAYDEFVASTGIGQRIGGLSASARDPKAYTQVADQIRALFADHDMPEEISKELIAAYWLLREDPDHAVAVRSSATAEDLAEASSAGQQDTYLNVRGPSALLTAVKDCWASLWTVRAMAYRARQGIDPRQVSLAVVVQTMVEADSAGVMFTANPANGRRDQVVISATWGLGESVVSGAVTTDDLVVDRATGRVLSRRTADKQVMTAYAAHGTEQRPVPEPRRLQAVLDDRLASALAGYGARIEAHYGVPQDIEWVYAGGAFFIVQARPITALPEPTADTPTDWTVPYRDGLYFRASIVEQLPDPLSPLFADLIDGAVARSVTALMREVFGPGVVEDGDVRLPTVNGYAYYYYRSAAFWRAMRRSPIAFAKLARSGARFGRTGWRDHVHPRYAQVVTTWAAKPVSELAALELLGGVWELLDACAVYYTAVQSIIPIAACSEILFRTYYDRLVKRVGDPVALTFLLGHDSEPIRAEKSLYDLAMWTRSRPALAKAILSAAPAVVAEALRIGVPPAQVDPQLWRQWCTRFTEHLERHGHVVYNLDFVSPVPADDPAPLLDALRLYLGGHGGDPYQRQNQSAARREEQTRAILARLDSVRRAGFGRLLRWAQSNAPVREDALADIGLAWPLVRRMLLELGRRLVGAGVITEASDVFWLRAHELRSVVEHPAPSSLADSVEQRKMLWRGQRKATAPQLLPELTWLQRLMGWAMPAGDQRRHRCGHPATFQRPAHPGGRRRWNRHLDPGHVPFGVTAYARAAIGVRRQT
ncbi:MAG: hypothetical protein JO100_12495 [Pseudonocardia sp.]|nr:hypothetical protein [Pseudonocardia sp.]